MNPTLSTIVQENNKTKFSHTKSKITFLNTFFQDDEIKFFMQCQSNQVFIGRFQSWQIIWKGTIKQTVTCISYCQKHQIIYAGTNKGVIEIINLQIGSNDDQSKIPSINGEAILAMFSYNNNQEKTPEIISIDKQGTLRKYKNNNYLCSVKLPFRVLKAVCSKTIKNEQDVGLVLIRQEGKYPYIFTPRFLIKLCSQENNKESVESLIAAYQKQQQYEEDEQIISEKVDQLSLSNSKAILAISEKNIITIYKIKQQNGSLCGCIDFKFEDPDIILSIDLVDSFILYATERGLNNYDLEKRKKPSKNLIFKGSKYEIGFWTKPQTNVVYGSALSQRMKLVNCQLNTSQ